MRIYAALATTLTPVVAVEAIWPDRIFACDIIIKIVAGLGAAPRKY